MVATHSILYLSLAFHIQAANYLDCTSLTTSTQCNEYKDEGCFWSTHTFECNPINCWEFNVPTECVYFKADYQCNWETLPQINTPICYERCPKLLDIVFIINVNNKNDAPKVLNYTKNIISIFNTTYPSLDNNHFALILFSIIDPVIIFNLNTGYDTNTYLQTLDDAFDSKGSYALLFNNELSNDSKAIGTAIKQIFSQSVRSHMTNQNLRRLAIYISAQEHYNIEQICHFTKQYKFAENNIVFYGAKINNNGTFNCFGDEFKFVTDSIITYDTLLHNDISYLLSSVCPHTLTPTVSPTYYPTHNPTFSPTKIWEKVLITNNTCINASQREQYRFQLPYDGIVSGILLEYVSGARKENQYANTSYSYWGSAIYNQFSIFVQDSNESPLYPDFSATRNTIDCERKYGVNNPKLLDFYYCFDDNISVNDTEFMLYAPSYTVTTNDEWSVFYADDLLNAFREHNVLELNIGIVCFAVNVLYERINTLEPTSNPTIYPTYIPTLQPTNIPTINPTNIITTNVLISTTNVITTNLNNDPSISPTVEPTLEPSLSPTEYTVSTVLPSNTPTQFPSISPSQLPTDMPTKYPSINPTETEVIIFENCCEFFLNIRSSEIKCDFDELNVMKTYSDYLMAYKSTCLTEWSCGYIGYFNNIQTKMYNQCQIHWLNIVLFKQICNIGVEAYDIYSNNICYLCNEFNVYYNYTEHPNGICFDKKVETKPKTTTTEFITTTANPSKQPTPSPIIITTESISTLSTTLNPSELPTISSTNNPTESSESNEIIIHYQNENNTEDNDNDSTNGNDKINNCANIIKCKHDNTVKICLLVILIVATITILIMFIIGCYYRKNYIKKDNEAYNDSTPQPVSSNISFSPLSYIRQFSDKSDIDEVKNKKRNNKIKNKQSKDNKKDVKDVKKSKSKQKKKGKKKKKGKNKNEDMKSKILAAISDSDDIELQAIISSDE